MSAAHPCEPVGLIDIAPRLGVDIRTPQQWNHRGILPSADWPSVSGRPAWCWVHTIRPWAEQVRRNTSEESLARRLSRLGSSSYIKVTEHWPSSKTGQKS